MQSNMTATLTYYGQSIPLQCLDNSVTGEVGHLAHTWIS